MFYGCSGLHQQWVKSLQKIMAAFEDLLTPPSGNLQRECRSCTAAEKDKSNGAKTLPVSWVY